MIQLYRDKAPSNLKEHFEEQKYGDVIRVGMCCLPLPRNLHYMGLLSMMEGENSDTLLFHSPGRRGLRPRQCA